MQTSIPTLFFRGGTSRGPFFNEIDLPKDINLRDRVLLKIMGSPDRRQIDGLGGAHPLTSKVGIVGLGKDKGIDLTFLFAQIAPENNTVDTTPNCGNMLSAVVPFALETGMLKAQGEVSTFRVLTLNTGMACDITVQTPNSMINYTGDAKIDGVPGTSAPITINFLDTVGSVCSSLLPTGHIKDTVDVEGVGSIEVTCIDNGMPLVIMRATDLERTGYEAVEQMDADIELKDKLEAIRLHCAQLMGLGDVSRKNYPKMTLLAPARNASGSVCTRSFIPHVCHDAIGVLAAVTVATACVLKGSVAEGIARVESDNNPLVSVEHPSGEFSVSLGLDPYNPQNVVRAALLRTARLIMRGEVMIDSDQ